MSSSNGTGRTSQPAEGSNRIDGSIIRAERIELKSVTANRNHVYLSGAKKFKLDAGFAFKIGKKKSLHARTKVSATVGNSMESKPTADQKL